MRILLDLDDVLVDFVGGACKVFNLTYEDIEEGWEVGSGHILPEIIGKKLKNSYTLYDFWSKIDGNEDFWANLKPLPWMNEVLNLVQELTDDWHIVSSPSHCASSYNGKVKWLKNYFSRSFNNFAITPHKFLFAKPDTILIDDKDQNVREFYTDPHTCKPTGAYAILFPRRWNSNHIYKGNEFAYVKHTLLDILSGSPC